MKSLDDKSYIKEIEKYYLNLKGHFSILSPKESQIILSWYKNNIDINLIKKLLKEEIIKLPKNKRKKFSLIVVDKKLQENLKNKKIEITQKPKLRKNRWEYIVKKLNLPEKLLKIPPNFKGDISLYTERRLVYYMWKNLPVEEKEKLIKDAIQELKTENILDIDKKRAIEAIIYDKIKKKLEGF